METSPASSSQHPGGQGQASGGWLQDAEANNSMSWSSQSSDKPISGSKQPSSRQPRGSAIQGKSTHSHGECRFGTMAPRSKPIQEDPGGKQKSSSIIPNTASCGSQSLLDLVCVLWNLHMFYCCLFEPEAVLSLSVHSLIRGWWMPVTG